MHCDGSSDWIIREEQEGDIIFIHDLLCFAACILLSSICLLSPVEASILQTKQRCLI